MKRAFTLLEVIFVLVIFAILAAIGSEILFKAYENYLLSRSASNTSYKLDVALLQIAQRLSYRIEGTEAVRDATNNLDTLSRPTSTAFSHIEWIGQAYEARRGEWNATLSTYTPGWSGLADLDVSDKTKLITPGSNLSYAKDIVSNIYGRDLSVANNGCALIFRGIYESDPLTAYGYRGTSPNAVHQVHIQNNTTFAFDNPNAKTISDVYYLTCSAFAIKHNSNNQLVLYYNYRPWLGESYTNGQQSVLLEDVTTFQIRKRVVNLNRPAGSIEIRICTEDNTTGTPIEFCGKKVVF